MDAYDIPKEFRNMQALDIGDLTFLDSLKANIKRIISKGSHQETIIKEAAATNKRESISNYLKRISMFLEDRNIASANIRSTKEASMLGVQIVTGKLYNNVLMTCDGTFSSQYITHTNNFMVCNGNVAS
jgi:hypothetical protein